jgi:hypothetical protein
MLTRTHATALGAAILVEVLAHESSPETQRHNSATLISATAFRVHLSSEIGTLEVDVKEAYIQE